MSIFFVLNHKTNYCFSFTRIVTDIFVLSPMSTLTFDTAIKTGPTATAALQILWYFLACYTASWLVATIDFFLQLNGS